MSCTDLLKSFGFECADIPDNDGNVMHAIFTPFKFFDGDEISLFAEKTGDVIRFFDAGDTLFHLAGSGIHFPDKRAIKPIERLISETGAALSDSGEISTIVSVIDAKDGFGKALSAILSICNWEAENVGYSSDITTLAGEVEMYLRQLKPKAEVIYDQKLIGVSGRNSAFNFLIDGEFIDVVSSSPQSTAAEVRKLADIRGISANDDLTIKVVIDDRQNAKRANQEAMIISRFADAILLSQLQSKASKITDQSIHLN
ncbi:MAG: DUF1828 domain-containing protein [Sulfuritalea sp.]|nr:DUF1828 domain-containing protein [Sulfuritalea sp.]